MAYSTGSVSQPAGNGSVRHAGKTRINELSMLSINRKNARRQERAINALYRPHRRKNRGFIFSTSK
jgi:hypothetical protein